MFEKLRIVDIPEEDLTPEERAEIETAKRFYKKSVHFLLGTAFIVTLIFLAFVFLFPDFLK